MTTTDLVVFAVSTLFIFVCVALMVMRVGPAVGYFQRRYAEKAERVLNRQLLMGVDINQVMLLTVIGVLACGMIGYLMGESGFWFVVFAVAAMFMPNLVLNHMEQKRRKKLETQLVDGITSLSSGVRAGLTLVQSMQLLAQNARPPIRQEIEHMLREYELGVDIGQAMLNASNRIRSPHYRLLFSAIQVHLQRGGDVAESLDRISDSVREIQRLDGKLTTLTAQGRSQAWMMGMAGIAIMGIGYVIAPVEAEAVLADPAGRFVLFVALLLVGAGAWWIRRIMSIDM